MSSTDTAYTIAIIGSRNFFDKQLLNTTLANHVSKYGLPSKFVSGGAAGADTLGKQWAMEIGLTFDKIIELIPNWSIGKHAGNLRNTEIINQADHIIAFCVGYSNGTMDSIKKAKAENKLLIEVHIPNETTSNTKNDNNENRIYFSVLYSEKDKFKQLGGKWDVGKKKWYILETNPNIAELKKLYQIVKV